MKYYKKTLKVGFAKTFRVHPPIWMLLAFLLTGCVGRLPASQDPATQTTILPTRTLTSTPISTVTLTPTTAPTPEPTPTPEPPGCLKPPDDYTRVQVNGWTLNARTLAMLEHAQALYGGELEIAGHAITQGSYTEGESASLGTHAGGGAVDLSVLRRGTYTVLWKDVEPVLHALRAAGFAAWLREYGELYEGSPVHIHAIAIGDRELSAAAEAQLTGEAGYFRGFSGLPVDADGLPTPDRYGGPLLCGWMIELGYQDLR